jgi:hypothetical protein
MISTCPRTTSEARTRPPLASLLLALSALLPGAVVPQGLEAQQRDLSMDRFEQEVQVRPDGSFEVEETLTLRFSGSWNGIERDLMTAHRTAEGRRARLRYRIDGVTDSEGRELEVEESSISGGIRLRIWVPGAEDAVRTVVLRYRVEGGLRFFTDELLAEGLGGPDAPAGAFDELYWNATGNGWEMPIAEARVRVRLPDAAAGVGAWGYTGYAGSTEQAVDVSLGPTEAEVRTTRPLQNFEGLTVSVTWDPGVVARPTAMDRRLERLMAYWPAGLPLVAFFGMFGAWRRHGRDPERRAIMVQYSPPEDLSPAEVGTLVDHKAEMHDITATLVDLAVRGYLLIEEEEKKGLLGKLGKTEYTFHQRRPRAHWAELRPHERRYLEGLFPERWVRGAARSGAPVDLGAFLGSAVKSWQESRKAGKAFDITVHAREWAESRGAAAEVKADDGEPMASVRLSELTNRFYTHLGGIRNGIYDELKRRGAYTARPDHARGKWAGLGVALLAGGLFAASMAAGADLAFLPHPVAVGIGFGVSGLIVLIFSGFMGVRTETGVRLLEHALGFKEFVERVETPQYKRMITSPDLFEKYLPYAMALKAEDRWAGAFEELYRQPPDWYRSSSSSGFRTTAFTRQMRSMSTDAGRTMASSPSSSGSGSGGGGSSGGGSGGGGGRGF